MNLIGLTNFTMYLFILLLNFMFSVCLSLLFSYYEPEPYMDEIFHVGQSLSYVRGNWTTWNDKITTPPGLYFLFYVFFKVINLFFVFYEIPIFVFRLLSSIFSLVNHYILLKICLLKHLNHPILVSFFLVSQPVLFFFSALFYTDQCSLTFVLLAVYYANCGRKHKTAFAIFLSVLVRQSNIIWIPFLMSVISSKTISKKIFNVSKKRRSLEWYRSLCSEFIKSSWSICNHIMKCIFDFCIPLCFVCFLFCIFVIVNGGIVLGDKSAHQATLNFSQIWLFFIFCAFCTSCDFLKYGIFQFYFFIKTFKNLKLKFILKCALGVTLLYVFVLVSNQYLSVVHPYLLADNRHYTFYIWRLFNKSYISYCSFTLIGTFTTFYFVNSCGFVRPLYFSEALDRLILFICIIFCLVTSGLFELRYFIVPFTLWYLYVNKVTAILLYFQIISNFIINIVVIYIFVAKPFEWNVLPGVKQRFMW